VGYGPGRELRRVGVFAAVFDRANQVFDLGLVTLSVFRTRASWKPWNQAKPVTQMDSAPSLIGGYHVASPWAQLGPKASRWGPTVGVCTCLHGLR